MALNKQDDFRDTEPDAFTGSGSEELRFGGFFPEGTTGTEGPQPEPTPTPAPAQTPEEIKATEETKTQVQDIIKTNLTAPQLPEAAQQEAVKLKDIVSLDSEQFQLEQKEGAVTTVPTEAVQLTAPDEVQFEALQATLLDPAATPEVKAIAIQEIKLIEAQTAKMTSPAEWVKGTVNPQDLAKVITMDIPEKAFVKGQLDELLSGLSDGEIPEWAKPAVAQAEAMLASKGMALSNVGQQGMFNAIISAAMPIAQADAKARMSIFSQELSQAQQTELTNSKFFQTMSLTNLNNEQQAAMLNATSQVQIDLTNATLAQKAQTDNAKNFLQRDISNQNAAMQAATINAQLVQQTLLSNQSAANTASQINATNQLQAEQFNSNLKSSIEMNNAAREDAMGKFVAAEENAMTKFNEQSEQQSDMFNTQNAIAIEQNNLQWRRDANKIDTAAENAINQANAMNALNLSNQSLAFLWNEMRDNAKMQWEGGERADDRKHQLAIAALGNEQAASEDKYGLWKTVGSFAYDLFKDNN
jgi:hypothetical protein